MTRIAFFLFVFGFLFQQLVSAQTWGTIKGEGEIVRQEITLPAIDGINLAFSGDVVLTPGSAQKIILEGQQNIIDNIKREVRDGHWNIAFEKNVKEAKKVTVYMTVPSLEDVGLSGSGSIRSTGTFTGLSDLDVSVSGSGDINFAHDSKTTDVRISGSGNITLSGATQNLDIVISGSGHVMAKELKASDCDISISGSGNATVQVNGDLETSISGSGDVWYTGNANVSARISGSGEVMKI
jgi:hypothetical protein